MKSLQVAAWLVTAIVCVATSSQAQDSLRTAADRPVDIEHIRLDLDVSLKSESIRGVAVMDVRANRKTSSFSLDAVGLKVAGVLRQLGPTLQRLKYVSDGKQIHVTFPKPLTRGKRERIHISYSMKQPKAGLHFFRPTKSEPKVPWMVWSQGEPRTNRYWFPCIDHPNERQTTEIVARVSSEYSVLSNGRLVKKRKIDGGKRSEFHWKQAKSHVAYLVTLVVGKFSIIEEKWRGRPVTYYVMPGREADAKRTFGRTREMLDFFSKRFGIEYPWEKYAQVVVEQFTSGGMENTSATTLYGRVMHDERAMIDSSPDRLIAHELGHQWWGNLVTCRDWSHLWLNEGFATYCEVLWREHKLGKDERDYLLYLKSRSARKGSALLRPVVDRRYPTPASMFDARAYPKGGWILHMLRSRLGDDDFFRGLNRYGVVYAYRTAETSDLRKVFERLYGVSLERFFYDWTQRKGHPIFTVKSEYNARDKIVRIDVRQTQKDEPFHFPLKIALSGAGDGGKPVVIRLGIKERNQTLFVPVTSRPSMVRVDPELTLLAEINEDKANDWWERQLKAPTVAERIRAVEHLATKPFAGSQSLLAATLKGDPFYGVRVEAAKALGKSVTKVSEAALLAGAQQKHPKVRFACVTALANFKQSKPVLTLLTKMQKRGDRSYKVEAALLESLATVQKTPDVAMLVAALGKKSHREVIRGAAMKGLAKSNDPQALAKLIEWTRPGHNRNARLFALTALGESLSQHKWKPDQAANAVTALAIQLKDDGPLVRRWSINALAKVPHLAKAKRNAIEAIAASDGKTRVRNAASKLLKAMDAPIDSAQRFEKLQQEFDRLKKQYADLKRRLDQLPKK